MRHLKLRRLLCFAAALALAIPALSLRAAAVDKSAAYEAYYFFLKTEEVNIGEPIADEDYYQMFSDYFTGAMFHDSRVEKILHAYLIDVTGDGVEELFLKRKVSNSFKSGLEAYHSNPSNYEWVCVYSYINGELVRIGQTGYWVYEGEETPYGKGYGTMEPEGFIGSIFSYEKNPYISDDCIYVCKGADGKYVLCDGVQDLFLDNHTFHLYRFDGSHFTAFKTFETYFHPDWKFGPIESVYGHMLFRIDGESVDRTTAENTLAQYTAGGVTKLVNNDYSEVLNQLEAAVERDRRPSDWAAAEVDAAAEKGYVPTTLAKNYTAPITRAEFCRLAVQFYERYTGETIDAAADFTDTQDAAVRKMAGLGVVNGVGGGRFDPDGTLTRQDAAAILMRLAGVMGYEPAAAENSFADRAAIAGYALDFVAEAAAAGIMNGTGNGNFSPLASYTREQSILTIVRLEKVA